MSSAGPGRTCCEGVVSAQSQGRRCRHASPSGHFTSADVRAGGLPVSEVRRVIIGIGRLCRAMLVCSIACCEQGIPQSLEQRLACDEPQDPRAKKKEPGLQLAQAFRSRSGMVVGMKQGTGRAAGAKGRRLRLSSDLRVPQCGPLLTWRSDWRGAATKVANVFDKSVRARGWAGMAERAAR